MFLFKKKSPVDDQMKAYLKMVEDLDRERRSTTDQPFTSYKTMKSGETIQKLSTETRRLFLQAVIEWWISHKNYIMQNNPAARMSRICILSAVQDILREQMPFTEEELVRLMDWGTHYLGFWNCPTSQLISALRNFLKSHPLTDSLRSRINQFIKEVEWGYNQNVIMRHQANLRELINTNPFTLPLQPEEAWTDTAIKEINELDEKSRKPWFELFNICAKAGTSSPSERWRKQALKSVEAIGFPTFKAAILRWFPLVESWRSIERPCNARYSDHIHPVNANLLRALVWTCAAFQDQDIARALTALAISTYRKLPGEGPRCLKAGNACIWALGNMPGIDGVGQLAILKLKVKSQSGQKTIENVLRTAAKRLNLPSEEIEELSVPTYGLEETGICKNTFGEYQAELAIQGNGTKITWRHKDGKALSTIPKTVKEQFREELKGLLQVEKDIRKMIPAQSTRIESVYLENRHWKFSTWRERYLDHPLIGTLARRLIWKFTRGDEGDSGIWWEGRIINRKGEVLSWLDNETRVELWHPISAPVEGVIGWREWLSQNLIQQPFKQAYREVYLLTEAEKHTEVYSNRYAAHVIKQHQFNALCGQRGWKNKLRLMVDDECPPAHRILSSWNLRAEFWIESIGEDYNIDTNNSGTYLYLSTDQVRFYTLNASENRVHATGGAYYTTRSETNQNPLPLENIPALVFSEIMRDVDLFVGVCSIGNDPNWMDGGRETRHIEYWTHYSFGDLSETAKTRKQVLEILVPKLKIGPRCSLTDRFLVVKGDIRTYKIHLGSGNILMEPNDQYLCIVPGQQIRKTVTDQIFLPFEGDNTLSIILSKAFLLAGDKKITDPTITRQLKR